VIQLVLENRNEIGPFCFEIEVLGINNAPYFRNKFADVELKVGEIIY